MTTTTIITLTVATVEEREVPPKNNQLGNMFVFDETSPRSMTMPHLRADTQVSAFVFESQTYGSVRPDGVCRVSRARPSPTPVNFRLEDSSTSALTLAQSLLLEGPTITDVLQGTSSSTKNDYTLTIETP
jgi:hypothetical protein